MISHLIKQVGEQDGSKNVKDHERSLYCFFSDRLVCASVLKHPISVQSGHRSLLFHFAALTFTGFADCREYKA
jgi:hypothetical protein